jgi:hypothetical protein
MLGALNYLTVELSVTCSFPVALKVSRNESPAGAGQTIAHLNSRVPPGLTNVSAGIPTTPEASSKTSEQDSDASESKAL